MKQTIVIVGEPGFYSVYREDLAGVPQDQAGYFHYKKSARTFADTLADRLDCRIEDRSRKRANTR